ncbi:AMP-binding protein [Microcoleus sp. FACHB-831]|uniref:non-ribosomal peptide synthetase n=1 Tax=Microcoleus sp. FACHB-831 TaxID=2692827 RepID=UPI0016892157|nr:condensation domain-containing protein [Microcoleus sp. FACHB-831]MBD1923726.1 AMP-binding protein [Microcoleus sp. FACHB-831]
MTNISSLKTYAIAETTNGNDFSYKLSPMQQSMLFNSISTQQAGLDIEQAICSLHENLNVSALMRAWQRVVERYEILRSYFSWEGLNEPVQTLHGQVELPFEHQNWCALSSSEQQDRLIAYIRDDRQRGFDIKKAPLMRLALLQLSDTEYKLACTFHNILLDNRSFAILCKQVFTFYEAFCQGQDLELPISQPYRHYIEWLQEQDLSKAETFWKETLRGFDAPTPLVVELAPNQRQSQQAGHGEEEIQLSEVVTSKLLVLAQDHALTTTTLIQGAWALILSRYSGEEDVVFGGVRECRPSALEGAESMLGLFINILPVRVSVSADVPVLTWLKQLQAAWISLEDYEQTPLAKVLEWSDIPRGTSLFESILFVENYEINSVLQGESSNCTNQEFQLIKQTTFPLTIYANFRKNLLLKIEYDRQRFDGAIINRMLGHLATSIESMVANPHQEITQLPMLTNWEQQQLWQWNETQANYGQDKCVHKLFEEQVEKTPDAVAALKSAIASSLHQDRQLTYQELNARANQLAHHLQQLGIKPDVFAAICIERSLEMAIAVLAILKAGGAYVPLDPAYPKERLAFMLADTQAPVILTQTHLVQSLPEHQARVICLDADWQSISQNSTTNPESSVTPDNLTYAIYTSGSTGKPKGVALEHRALSNLISWQLQNSKLTGEARTLQFASLSFDVSFQEMFSTWCAGGTLVFISEEIRRDAPRLLQFINNEKIERLFLPFIALQHIAEAADTYAIAPQSISEVVTAGEQLQINRYIAGFFKQLKNWALHNGAMNH